MTTPNESSPPSPATAATDEQVDKLKKDLLDDHGRCLDDLHDAEVFALIARIEQDRQKREQLEKENVDLRSEAINQTELSEKHLAERDSALAKLQQVEDTREQLTSSNIELAKMNAEKHNKLQQAEAERDKGQQFKQYVHDRLDTAGVPTSKAEADSGKKCRIELRLSALLAERDRLRAVVEAAKKLAGLPNTVNRIGPWDDVKAAYGQLVTSLAAAEKGGGE